MLSGEVVGRRRGGVLAVLVIALACALALPAVASAEQFRVESAADDKDLTLDDGVCITAADECTLRAAIEEANSPPAELDEIRLEEEIFEGRIGDTIHLNESLPPITDRVSIEGRGQCPTDAGMSGPCAGIDGPGDDPALVVEDVDAPEGGGIGVEITGIAITGARIGVEVLGSSGFKAQSNWFGVMLDGSTPGNETGILIDQESDASLIGSEGLERGNVFAGNSGNGLEIHDSDGVRILGNYFGVEKDGVTPAANGGDAVEVTEAVGTAIGTRVSASAAASPPCDGGCNVISAAASNGVDLQGEGEEDPAASTSVAGNYIGLNANGTAAVPNAGAGVRVGEAGHTLVGGPSGGEANRVNGGIVGIVAGPAAADLSIRGNLIGTDASGLGTLAPPGDGIAVDSAKLPSPAVEAEIFGNKIRMEDGIAITQRGEGAWILGNEIIGSQIGIKTSESTAEFGNVIEENLIEGPAISGILVENNFNEIAGNEVLGTGAAGIWIQGLPSEATRNLIGGDTATDENLIDGSGGAAIEISNVEATDNEVARNRGAGNAGPFIDLVAASPGTEVGPNRGVQPPTFSIASQAGVSGGAAEGATVRVFRKQLAAAGELESFLGEAVADSAGGWELTYEAAIPAGTIIAATQTKDGATSELAVATTPGSEGAVGGGAGGAFESGVPGSLENAIARIRPRTKIVKGSARHRTARFVFESDRGGSTFLCKLDGKPFDLCRSPKRYVGLSPGKHVFWVRAVDSAGRVDLSPAKKKFVVPG